MKEKNSLRHRNGGVVQWEDLWDPAVWLREKNQKILKVPFKNFVNILANIVMQ
jgi:hypothetical protein